MSETRLSHGFPLSVAVRTDVGRVRGNNEDSHGHAWLDDGSLFVIVADGMGGHEAGEVASGLAVRVLEDAVCRDPDKDPRELLYHGLLEANDAILDEGRRSGTRGMGTTSITAIFHGNQVHAGLIGDSRMYHVRKGQLVWRTLDHTRVQMLIDRGEITEEAARTHPEAGMLTRALGHSRMADGRPLVPDVLAEPIIIEENDAVVFCSDGLHDLVDDWELAKLIAGLEAGEAAQRLIDLANERGGHDNITVAVVIGGETSEPYDPDYVPESFAAAAAEPEPPAASASVPNPVDAAAPASAPPGIVASADKAEGGPTVQPWMIGAAVGVALLFLVFAIAGGMVFGLVLLPYLM